ncbi:UDP-N-acetylmuramoyl-tripeptide--D-alanyl-D-alanine ligase [Clostridium tetanomorphum]|uniref:UDP-N-acetylmuramoyl-tripeptide--D-alanyl-D-alanine ligase n=1 Tax=Clostridium tetanomorphum TaxID=1553 RepID=A0A923J0U8_CLOTT|nr:UDP-N-acetylmuramoyl-tripeptide--D-alanyl-D-alanine ligase [Clostridium tetanomorphum]MBC2396623.1 UDP-N-acetylmuramoyl-tripeptide--D-alanyl-D-alanine ligase [Clostridium tetanomorphum]NRZ98247.1 UDP-N-acetylmuramoyl-tripeptide--D-alanyl-D-alanine ligase [Clostridium tetanomorphum]
MEYLGFDEIVKAIEGEVLVKGDRFDYDGVSTDTRKIEKKNIFIALKGENFNGNAYMKQASEKGALICIIDEVLFTREEIQKHTSIIKVKDTRKALLDLAKYYRSKLNIKVIGITGSTGKTSTKDLTASVLSGKYKVFKTEGNFNNEIGLPLMIFRLDKSYEIAVLEMGMSNLQEIHRMAEVANPDIAIITNIGISHIENLKTRENILKAKLEITDFFKEKNVLIVNGDNDLLGALKNNKIKIIKTGFENKWDFYAYDIVLNESDLSFKVIEETTKEEEEIYINIPGKHNIWNALLAIACGRNLNMSFKEIKEGLKNLQTTAMRLDIIKNDSFTIVNDCYNASPDSMKAAIDVLIGINGKKKVAVLGTMKELGKEAYRAHKEVGSYAKENGVDLLIALGEFDKAFIEGFEDSHVEKSIQNSEKQYLKLDNYDEVIDFLLSYLEKEDVVLFKASRAMKFEKMVEKLKNN